jgi:hypothetical protein
MTAAYETQLNRDLQWALQEGSMFFEQKSGLHLTLRNVTQRLRELNVPYAVAGGMAMFFHGFRRFTDPEQAGIEREGSRWLNLPALVELKLASGMTAPGRLKDLADVQELIRLLPLPADFAEQLQPFVREEYGELWRAAQV